MPSTPPAGEGPSTAPAPLRGRRVVVTGGARGLGRGIATRFAAEGARVLVCDVSDAVHEVAAEMAREVAERGGPSAARGPAVVGVRTDVTDPGSVDALFAAAREQLGGVDVLVNNAGVISIERLADLTPAEWHRVVDVNATGTFLCCRAAAAMMQEQGRGGRLINAASGQARQGFIYTPHYAASKFAVVGLTQSLAKELARDGITVNAYCPGIVATDMWSYNDARWGELLGGYAPGELMAEWVAGIPMGRAGTADDVAGLLLFLASDAAGYITGQTINVDGGMFMS